MNKEINENSSNMLKYLKPFGTLSSNGWRRQIFLTLFILGVSKFCTTASMLVWLTLQYDTHSRLLIRPHEKQQVDVRKVINHSANMAANRPVAFTGFFFFFNVSAKRIVGGHALWTDAQDVMCIPRIFVQSIIFCLELFNKILIDAAHVYTAPLARGLAHVICYGIYHHG